MAGSICREQTLQAVPRIVLGAVPTPRVPSAACAPGYGRRCMPPTSLAGGAAGHSTQASRTE